MLIKKTSDEFSSLLLFLLLERIHIRTAFHHCGGSSFHDAHLQEAHVSTLEAHLALVQKEQGEVMTKATEVEYQEGAAKARNTELAEANAKVRR